jgi:hypothetical protein
MTYRLLTCPETAHLELIEHLDDPLGTIITGCSRFRPPCELACPRTCAAQLDRGARETLDSIEIVDAASRDPTAATDVGIRRRHRPAPSEHRECG